MEKAKGRQGYADVLRVMSALAVVVIHLTGRWVDGLPYGGAWMVCHMYDALCRWAVPMFVMLSGMFLLDPGRELGAKRLARQMARVVVPLLFWGVVYGTVELLGSEGRLTGAGLLGVCTRVMRGENHFHLWFLYMIAGLYVITPPLRAFVRGAERRDFHFFFGLYFVLALLIPTALQIRPSALVERYLSLTYLPASALRYVGYYVAGYYFRRYPPACRTRQVCYVLAGVGTALMIFGTAYVPGMGTAAGLPLYGYCTPWAAVMTLAVFFLVQRHTPVRAGGTAWLSQISGLTFGAYLVHMLWMDSMARCGLDAMAFWPVLSVPVLAGLIFLCSAATAWVIQCIPVLGKFLV